MLTMTKRAFRNIFPINLLIRTNEIRTINTEKNCLNKNSSLLIKLNSELLTSSDLV